MKIEKVLGKLNNKENTNKNIDYAPIEWYNSAKKIQRITTTEGREIGIMLDEHTASHGLFQDDILAETDEYIIAVDILPCEVLVISGDNAALLPKICYEIGNRHAPFFYADNHKDFITPFDKPIQVMLEKIGAVVRVETLKINLAHKISSSHGGNAKHSH